MTHGWQQENPIKILGVKSLFPPIYTCISRNKAILKHHNVERSVNYPAPGYSDPDYICPYVVQAQFPVVINGHFFYKFPI